VKRASPNGKKIKKKKKEGKPDAVHEDKELNADPAPVFRMLADFARGGTLERLQYRARACFPMAACVIVGMLVRSGRARPIRQNFKINLALSFPAHLERRFFRRCRKGTIGVYGLGRMTQLPIETDKNSGGLPWECKPGSVALATREFCECRPVAICLVSAGNARRTYLNVNLRQRPPPTKKKKGRVPSHSRGQTLRCRLVVQQRKKRKKKKTRLPWSL